MSDVKERELNMANALRRGPGWWMDPDGNWNPPEVWPESTPPLPDWIRDENGRWHAPAVDRTPLEVVPDIDESPVAPAPRPTPSKESAQPAEVRAARSASSLSYAAYTKLDPEEFVIEGTTVKRALFAALGAGITASMISAGVTVLVGLF